MKNKVVLVTGATDGIGKETALKLAGLGAGVLLHGRDERKCTRVLDEIKRVNSSGSHQFFLADFSSLADVAGMAADIMRSHSQLDVLVNNAGNFYKTRKMSADDFEMTFAVNHLAPFLLTLLLLDLLKAAASARIVNVASSAHKSINRVDFDNLQGEKEYDPFTAYCLSKLGNVLFTKTLARKLAGSGVSVNALHPGVVSTNLLRKSYHIDRISTTEGAKTSVYLASSPKCADVSGMYFKNSQDRKPSELANDKDLQNDFWKISEEMVSDFIE